jgi:large subunit ribosomal protein L21
MYAIIEDSGTQIKLAEGDTIRVAKRELSDDQASLTFEKVLMLGQIPPQSEGQDTPAPMVGAPYVQGASVTADILREDRTERVPVVKFKRRKTYVRRKSHRQDFLEVKVTGIFSQPGVRPMASAISQPEEVVAHAPAPEAAPSEAPAGESASGEAESSESSQG